MILLFILLFAVNNIYAEDSATRMIQQQYHCAPVLPLLPDQAAFAVGLDSSHQKIFAEVQVRYADHCLDLLQKLNLSTNKKLIQEINGLRAEWQVITNKYQEAISAAEKARRWQQELDLYFLKQETLISEMRVLGADESADRAEQELRHEQMLHALKNQK
jgi:hypothetical protein